MFDSVYANDSSGMFVPHTPCLNGSADIFEAARPRKEFRQQKLGIYLLSDLFSSSFMGNSRFVRDRRLISLARDKTVSFTGETFDQWDLDVLMHCALRTVLSREGGGKIQIEPAEMLRDMGLRNYEENRDRVYTSLFRLHTGSLLIEGKGYSYMTRLIDRVLLDRSKDQCLVEVNGDVVNSLRYERNLRMTVENRFSFKRNGLAKWLYGAVRVFKGGFKADIDCLHVLCGASNRNRYIFPQMLGKALDAMEKRGVVESWELDVRQLMVFPSTRQRSDAACGFIESMMV